MTDADMRYARSVAFIFDRERGFVNDPEDPGGATNLGITIGTLSRWLGSPATIDDVRNLTRATASLIYRQDYWPPADNLPAGVDLMYFNASVNCGAREAAELLQRACGAVVDGKIGPNTLTKVKSMNAAIMIANFKTAQHAFYVSLHGWDHDGSGWTNRLNACAALATNWVTP